MRQRSRSRRPRPAFVSAWRPERRPLITLVDQGPAGLLNPTDFGIAGRDRSWNSHAQNFISANRPELAALEVQPELVPTASEISFLLRPGGMIGAIPLRRPDTRGVAGGLVVRPRFGWNGVGAVLQRVGWTASPRMLELPLVPGSTREVPPWVLAGPVTQRLASLLKELHRGFRMHEAMRETPRGQILWGKYACEQMVRGAFHRFPCRYSELGPDTLLRGYIRWALERVQRTLMPHATADAIALRLLNRIEALLSQLMDATARVPDRAALDHLMRGGQTSSQVTQRGLQALGWVAEERGLAGTAESDGLSWALPMHDLFERWVEHLTRGWAHEFGGTVQSGREFQTAVPIQWERPPQGTLKSLVPDLVVRHRNHVYVIDAKYKGHFEELDEARWLNMAEEIREQHRHDLHQVLAYASLFGGADVTAVLVYPMRLETWSRLVRHERTTVQAVVTGADRELRLVLTGVPIQLPDAHGVDSCTRSWNSFVARAA